MGPVHLLFGLHIYPRPNFHPRACTEFVSKECIISVSRVIFPNEPSIEGAGCMESQMLGESGQVIQAASLSEVIRSEALAFHPILKLI